MGSPQRRAVPCTSLDRISLVVVSNSSGKDRVGWEAVEGDERKEPRLFFQKWWWEGDWQNLQYLPAYFSPGRKLHV